MGLIISKFRKKKSTIEVLEEIDKNIATHQRFKRQNQEYQKKFIASLILYSIITYVIAVVIFFICYFPQTWKDWLFASIPLLLFPVLIWLVKKLMHWYFVKRIASNELKLQELRDKKKDILEDVMENEVYKKAKEILEKYDPSRFKKLEIEKPGPSKAGTEADQVPEDKSAKDKKVVRQRVITTRTMSPVMRMPNPVQPMSAPHPHQSQRTPNPSAGSPMQMVSQMNGRQMSMVPIGYGRSPGPPMPRPVPPRERKTLDKFVDYLVGEGPQNRYALICRYCNSHNGMALKEEFEYISFRCCYCYHLNPAKKQRPHAPRLDFPTPQSSPARKAIAAPDSKPNEEKESSEEDDDDLSTSSRKSEDETIETEKADTEGSDEAPDRATKSEAESVKDAGNTPLADEDGTEENLDEGIEKLVEDESAVIQDITEESLAADNHPQAMEEDTTEYKEHKTKTEEAVVSKIVTKENAPLTSAEKPNVVQGSIISAKCGGTEEPVKVPTSVDKAVPEIIKDVEKSPKPMTEETAKSMEIDSPEIAKEPPKSSEVSEVVEEASTTAEVAPKVAEVVEEASTTVEVAPKVAQAIEEALTTVESAPEVAIEAEISRETEILKIAEEALPTTEEALINVDTAAKEVSVTTETNAQQTAEDVLMPTVTAEDVLMPTVTAEDVLMPTVTADKKALINTESEEVLKTEESLIGQMTEKAPVAEEALTSTVTAAMVSPITVDTAAEEIPMVTEIDAQQIAEEALVSPINVNTTAEAIPSTVDTSVKEAVMSSETDAPQIDAEVLVTVDIAAGEIAVNVVDQAVKEASTTVESAPEVAQVVEEASTTVESAPEVAHVVEEASTTVEVAPEEAQTVEEASTTVEVSPKVVQAVEEALTTVESVPEVAQVVKEASTTVEVAPEVALITSNTAAEEISMTVDTAADEASVTAEVVGSQLAPETGVALTADTTVEEVPISVEADVQQIASVTADTVEEIVELDEYDMIPEFTEEAAINQNIAEENIPADNKHETVMEKVEAVALKENISTIGDEKLEKPEVSNVTTTGDLKSL